MTQAEIDYPGRLVFALYYQATIPYPIRDSYYTFAACPATIVDGVKVEYTKITSGSIFPSAINRNSGVSLTATLAAGTLSGSVTNTSGRTLSELRVRVVRVSMTDMVYKPNIVQEIEAQEPLITPLADGASDTYSISGLTAGASERFVVFVQSDTNKEIFHAMYVNP